MPLAMLITGLRRASLCVLLGCLTNAKAEVSVAKDVSYLGSARAEKMDIYTPAGATKTRLPAVLLIHGGGWVGGDTADKRGISISTEVSEEGYVVFAINYKVAPKDAGPETTGAFPQNVFDCKSALRFIRLNAERYHVDPRRIGVMGESAGGHLAVLLGATSHVRELNQGGLYTGQSNDVTCIVDMYGIPDLIDSSMSFIVAPFQGKTPQETGNNLRLGNPIHYLSKSTPPVLILHGTADALVPIAQSRRFAARLEQLGVPHQFVEVPGGVHSFNLHPDQMDLRPIVFAFLEKYLKNPL